MPVNIRKLNRSAIVNMMVDPITPTCKYGDGCKCGRSGSDICLDSPFTWGSSFQRVGDILEESNHRISILEQDVLGRSILVLLMKDLLYRGKY